MQNSSKNSHKIDIGTKHENKANKCGFAILSLSSKKFYVKPFSDRAKEIRLKP